MQASGCLRALRRMRNEARDPRIQQTENEVIKGVSLEIQPGQTAVFVALPARLHVGATYLPFSSVQT